ncbi:hypothetical protein [Sphingomonas sp.]|uniref:hypothetical protein n=1 Tax=Sphingomonas sp. TaxID=28214 RepID=UPI003B3B7467
MSDWPRWEVSALSPLVGVERVAPDLVRNIAIFPIAEAAALKSAAGEAARARTRLAMSAPYLAAALEAACVALRGFEDGTATPDLADTIASAGEQVLAAARGELG